MALPSLDAACVAALPLPLRGTRFVAIVADELFAVDDTGDNNDNDIDDGERASDRRTDDAKRIADLSSAQARVNALDSALRVSVLAGLFASTARQSLIDDDRRMCAPPPRFR